MRTLRVLTAQSKEVWDQLREKNSLVSDPLKSPFIDYSKMIHSYTWIKDYYKNHIPGAKGDYLWWGELVDYSKFSLNDLKESYSDSSDLKDTVFLLLSIPIEKCLISCFDAWATGPFSGSPVYLTWEESEEDNEPQEGTPKLSLKELRELLKEADLETVPYKPDTSTWERIFNLDHWTDPNSIFDGDMHLQVCFEDLNLLDVIGVYTLEQLLQHTKKTLPLPGIWFLVGGSYIDDSGKIKRA